MIKAVIVDDEAKSRSIVEKILTKYCKDISIVGQADDIHSGYTVISKEQPDLVFLDIEMPSGLSFELLQLFSEINFEVIFITAYDHYAIKAIEFNCLSYILKPISIEKILNAVEKTKAILSNKASKDRINNLLALQQQKTITPQSKIALPTLEGLEFIRVNDIISLEADSSYTWIFTVNKGKIISTRTLKEFEELLFDYNFIRVHRKYIINPSYIQKYIKGEGGLVEMENRQTIPISKRRKNEFLSHLQRL